MQLAAPLSTTPHADRLRAQWLILVGVLAGLAHVRSLANQLVFDDSELFGVARTEHEVSALVGQLPRHEQAQTTRTASDNDKPVLEGIAAR